MKKKILQLGLGLLCGVMQMQAQTMLDSVFIEKYHVATVADNAADPNLPVGAVTYRIYIDMKAGFKLQSVYGDANHDLTFSTSTSFYNSPNGSGTPNTIKNPSSTDLYDTWLSLGTDSKGFLAVPLTENTSGKIAGTIAAVTTTSGTLDAAITNSFDSQSGAGTFTINGDAYANANGVLGSTITNSILIGQFTTDGTFSYALNFQLGNTTGKAEVYVASSPSALTDGRFGEYSVASLMKTMGPNVPPTVSLELPTIDTSVLDGTVVLLKAMATDSKGANGALGSIKRVDFFAGTTFIGSSKIAPYTLSWTTATGAYLVKAIAVDGDNDSTTSTAITVTVNAKTLTVSSATASIVHEGTATTITVISNIAR